MTEYDPGRRWIEPDPNRRQPLKRLNLGPAVVRFVLDRSSDSASRSEPTQDCVVLGYDRTGLCFAVTDGVGSSFVGELAARILAHGVARWLFELPEDMDERTFSPRLTDYLKLLAKDADKLVAAFPIPADRPPLVTDVLKEQRAYGSEAMLVCGRIEWPNDGRARVWLAWLGDAYMWIQPRKGEAQRLRGRTSDRWSSSRGPRGDVRSMIMPTEEVDRIIACSDGLLPELNAAIELADSALDARLLRLARTSASDDIAYLDVAVNAASMPPSSPPPGLTGGNEPTRPDLVRRDYTKPATADRDAGGGRAPGGRADADDEGVRGGDRAASRKEPGYDERLGRPASLRPRRTDSAYQIVWERVREASTYNVQLAGDPDFSDPIDYSVDQTVFTLPALAFSRMWVRVRARSGQRTGPWTEGLPLDPGDLPPPSREPRTREPRGYGNSRGADETLETVPRDRDALDRPVNISVSPGLFGQQQLRWNPVTGAETYVVEIENSRSLTDPPRCARVTRARIDLTLSPGLYYIWVRASSRDRPGSWSAPAEIRIRLTSQPELVSARD